MLAHYGHFLRTAASLQWDEAAIDLRPDAAEWATLPEPWRRRVTALVAGFCVGEARVAEELEPFARAAADADAAACFEVQAIDEARHARLFDRVAAEVLGHPASTREERAEAMRAELSAAFVELFDERLPATGAALARGGAGLEQAVGLYHMVLEGVVFTAGQLTLIEALDELGALPGLRRGVELVLRDEHWHIGFGARCLQDLGPGPGTVAALAAEGDRAVAAWGGAIGPATADRVRVLHRRRLRAAGLLAERTAA